MSGLVVVGASYAGIQAALSARDSGYAERITVVADDHLLPYQRPPLSKDFLLDKVTQDNLVLRDDAFFKLKQIDLILETRVHAIDRRARQLSINGNTTLDFDKLFIGTGSHARRLTLPGSDLDGVCYLRSIRDAVDLKERLRHATEIVVIGGGFIGLEVAASASKLGKKVTLIETASRLLERSVSPLISQFLLDLHTKHGVAVRLNDTVAGIEGQNGRAAFVTTAGGACLRADLVLVGIGGVANDQLARDAQLNCTNGIVVDDHGMTDDPSIYAAGDCANHYNAYAGDWLRLESVQNAQDQAKAAGLAIAGKTGPYDSVPRFWSDQYDAKLQTVGISRNFDRQAVRGSPETGQFSVFYYKQNKLCAVDSVSRAGDQMAARRLIGSGISPTPEQAADLSFDFKSLLTTINTTGA
jgi:3-phenylpropionate/trans-cinnamate dioxygenase ferredoxin reductase component